MRIVLLAPDLGGTSGWSRYALDLGRALARRGHELHCLTAHRSDADWCAEYPVLRPATSYLGSAVLCALHGAKVARLLKKIDPDVVHVVAEPYALMFPFMRRHAWKEILTIHGTYSVVPLLMGFKTARLARSYYRRMDGVIAVSGFTKGYLGKRIPDLADVAARVTVVPNAIEMRGIAADAAARGGEPFVVMSVSGVKRKKGYLQSVRAIKKFLEKHPVALRYDIVGDAIDPPFTRELKKEIETSGLTDVVRFRGKISDAELDAAYREADLFLLPSLQEDDYFEGFGLVFIEANARGTPCIGGTTGGCPEAIEAGTSGYVCDPDDADAIAARMEDVLLNGRIDRAACRAWAEAHDVDRRVADIEAVYASA